MKNASALSCLFASTVLLAACGGSEGPGAKVENKEQAAKAAYGVLETGQDVNGRSASGLRASQFDDGTIGGINGDGVSVETTRVVTGKEGKATVTSRADVGTTSVEAAYTVKYEGFTLDGINYLDGEMTYIAKVTTGGEHTSAVTTEMRGAVDLRGEVDSHIEADVTLAVTVDGAAASITFNGKISADGVSFDYTDEVIHFDDIETRFSL